MAKNSIAWHIFDDAKTQSLALAENVANDIILLLAVQERVTLSVPGGTTPRIFLNQLSKQDVEWSRVDVVLNDERWVPLTHDQSNEAMLKKQLQQNMAEEITIFSLYDARYSVEQAVHHFNQRHILQIDICVLGMGVDGHTASLFPEMEGLEDALAISAEPRLIVSTVPGKEQRVSLNLSALLTAKKHYVLIKGQDKKQVLEQAALQRSLQWPISCVVSEVLIETYYSNS